MEDRRREIIASGKKVDYSKEYFTIVSLEDNNVIGWKAGSNQLQRQIYVSTDKVNWTSHGSTASGTTLVTLNAGDRLYVKSNYGNSSAGFGSSSYMNSFTSTGNFNVEGNIMSLLYYDNFVSQTALTATYTFYGLFYQASKLISARNFVLPATTLASYCYYMMFCGCTSLVKVPNILPATTLAAACYYFMFANCTSLTATPKLPATTLANGCYYYMFGGCKSLTTAPDLPAVTLPSSCYECMFNNCANLSYVKCLATSFNSTDCTTSWLNGVAPTGTFVKDAGMNAWSRDENGIPSGWTTQDYSE